MQITEDLLRRSWGQLTAGSDLLDAAMFPPIGTMPEQYEQRVATRDGLFLVLPGDGTVCGYDGPYHQTFLARDLDDVLYFVAEEAVRQLADHIVAHSPGQGPVANLVTGQAELMDRISPAWGRRYRSGGPDDTQVPPPCGRDPWQGLAWIAAGWREQEPYTHLAFFRGEGISAEEIAVLHGADPEQVANGTRLADLHSMDGTSHDHWDIARDMAWEIAWESYCFGQAGDWAFLLYHETAPGFPFDLADLARLGVTETVDLSATSAKAIYTLTYMCDGQHVDDGGVGELIWYDRGRAPYHRGGPLDFLNQALRRAELDHPELTNEFELYFHALETSLGLTLPQQEIQEGTVRAARWARGGSAGR